MKVFVMKCKFAKSTNGEKFTYEWRPSESMLLIHSYANTTQFPRTDQNERYRFQGYEVLFFCSI